MIKRQYAIAIVCLMLLGSCETTPTTPGAVDGTIRMGEKGEFLLALCEVPGGLLEIRARNLSWDPIRTLAELDVYLLNRGEPINAPLHLSVVSISPAAVQFTNADGLTNDGLLYKEFSSEFGDDGVLTQSESSEPVTFRFDVGSSTAFSIQFRADFGFEKRGVIAGTVFRDDDRDGMLDAGEPGLGDVDVRVRYEKSDGSEILTPRITNPDGTYRFMNLASGAYTVTIDLPDGSTVTSANPLVLALLENPDGSVGTFETAHFGVRAGVSTDGILAHYAFSGNARDQSGNENHGTVAGAVLTTDRHGMPNMAYQLDGVDDYILVPDSPSLNPTDAITLSLWFRLDERASQDALITKGLAPGIFVWSVHVQFDAYVAFGIRGDHGGTFGVSHTSPQSLIDGAWHHVAGTFDGELMKIYLDGVLVDSEQLDQPRGLFVTGEPLYIGHGYQVFDFFPGALDDIRIYGRALSNVEVQGLGQE